MNIYVSLTSIYQKQKLLLNTLNSIKNQTLLPCKCYLFLSEEPYLLDKGFKGKILDKSLENFINENSQLFEVRWCENIGPYRKLLPLLKEKWNEDCLILTIDDDIVYNKDIIKSSVNDYKKHKCCIGYRGFTPDLKNVSLANLQFKKGPKQVSKHLYNFVNSGIATVNHPSFYHKTGDLVFNLEYIKKYCETTDDIWYYLCRIVNNIETFLDLNKKPYLKLDNSKIRVKTALWVNYNGKNRSKNFPWGVTNGKNFKKVVDKFIELKLI